MYLSGNRASAGDKKLGSAKAILNPNATEFVPFALRSPIAGISSAEASSKYVSTAGSTQGKGILDRSESSVSNISDDEVQQYWQHQLPDDITPDFKVSGIDDSQGINNLPFSSLSLSDLHEGVGYTVSTGSRFMPEQQGLSPRPVNGNSYPEKLSYGEFRSPTSFRPSVRKPWDHPLTSEGLDGENRRHSLPANVLNEQLLLENTDFSPIEFLGAQFPGFAPESLAELYLANAGNLNVTVEMLIQLELQADGGLNQTLNSKTSSAPSLSSMDIPTLSVRDGRNNLANSSGSGLHLNGNRSSLFRSNSLIPSRGIPDFASAVTNMAPPGSPNASVVSGRSSQFIPSSYNGSPGRGVYVDRQQSRESAHSSPVWLETGEAVANMYSETREEACDHARLRNAYFEQARQAYLIGNKAKELSIKAQLFNMQQTKGAYGKAHEAIYRNRSFDIQANGRERAINLYGLQLSEAIHLLQCEVAVTKIAARATGQHIRLNICVGMTGRGLRTNPRLLVAVQRYLLEEGLEYSDELQSGILHVVIYAWG